MDVINKFITGVASYLIDGDVFLGMQLKYHPSKHSYNYTVHAKFQCHTISFAQSV